LPTTSSVETTPASRSVRARDLAGRHELGICRAAQQVAVGQHRPGPAAGAIVVAAQLDGGMHVLAGEPLRGRVTSLGLV
jgi:hypothetical protein